MDYPDTYRKRAPAGARRGSLPRLLLLLLLIPALLLPPGCGASRGQTTTQPCEIIARVMLAGTPERDEDAGAFHWFLYDGFGFPGFGEAEDYRGDEEMASLLADFYGLSDLKWFDAAIVRMEGARAFELAVLSVPEESIGTVVEAWQEYLLDRRGDFTGYLPEQAALVEGAKILTHGQEAALLICEDPEGARDAFEACYGDGRFSEGTPDFLLPQTERLPDGRYAYTDPGTDDMTVYDTSAILAAWRSGDASGLSEHDRLTLEAAEAALRKTTDSGMRAVEKELALYRWLTANAVYDQRHYDPGGCPRTSYEPYGPLVEHTGVCLGFASAFQLLMDMADIECITVVGAAYRSREDHAWNMVRLDGAWYCADPTWDLHPGGAQGESYPLQFFNVTSDRMAGTDHQWDYASVPEATGGPDGAG